MTISDVVPSRTLLRIPVDLHPVARASLYLCGQRSADAIAPSMLPDIIKRRGNCGAPGISGTATAAAAAAVGL